jgi:hypothetical protein
MQYREGYQYKSSANKHDFYEGGRDGEKKKGCRKENIFLQPCTKVFGLMEKQWTRKVALLSAWLMCVK